MPDESSYVAAIRRSGLSIYDPIEIGDPALWIPAPELEHLLDRSLDGLSLAGFPLPDAVHYAEFSPDGLKDAKLLRFGSAVEASNSYPTSPAMAFWPEPLSTGLPET